MNKIVFRSLFSFSLLLLHVTKPASLDDALNDTIFLSGYDGKISLSRSLTCHAQLLEDLVTEFPERRRIPLKKWSKKELRTVARLIFLQEQSAANEQTIREYVQKVTFKQRSEHQLRSLFELGDYLDCTVPIIQSLATICAPAFMYMYNRFSSNNERILSKALYDYLNGDIVSMPSIYQPYVFAEWAKDISVARRIKVPMHTDSFGNMSGQVVAVAFNKEGSILASATRNGTFHLWNPKNGELLNEVFVFQDYLSALTFSPDGNHLAIASHMKKISIWDVQTCELLHTLPGHDECVTTVAFSPDGSLLASSSYDRTVRLWDTATYQCLHTLHGHSNIIKSVVFNSEGTICASGSIDKTIRLYNPSTGELIRVLRYEGNAQFFNAFLAFSPDGKTLAATAYRNNVALWDPATGTLTRTLTGEGYGGLTSIAFSPDGSLFVTASRNNGIRMYDFATGKRILSFSGSEFSANAIAFSPDGTTIAAAKEDKRVLLWSGYQEEMHLVTDKNAQALLSSARLSWLANKAYPVVEHNPIYQKLIRQFPYLDDEGLFIFVHEVEERFPSRSYKRERHTMSGGDTNEDASSKHLRS